MGFWIVTAAASALVALAILAAYLRPRDGDGPAASYDLQVYRDQLKEVDRDLERGVLTGPEAARARTEVSRRILDADRALQNGDDTAPVRSRAGKTMLAVALIVMVAGSYGVYLQIGAPGYPDLPLQTRISLVEQVRSERPSQAEAEAELDVRPRLAPDPEREALVVQLRTVMEQRPDDPEGLMLLAQNEAALGNFRAARLAQGRLIAILGDDVTAQNLVDHAEMMILAAGGYVSPEAESALMTTLQTAPQSGTARYYAGLMYAQQGRPDLAYPIWRNLLAESTPEAPWLEPIRLQIEEVAAMAGDNITLAELPQPQSAPGPTAGQMRAAESMSPDDQRAMVEGMVGGLAERLATEGGPPEEWARLIAAFLVLEQPQDARAIRDEALQVFVENPDALAMIAEAAAPLAETFGATE